MIKAVLIDLDNTLYAYDVCNDHAVEFTLKKISKMKNIPYENIRQLFDEVKLEVKKKTANTAFSHSRFLYFKHLLKKIEPESSDDKIDDGAAELDAFFWREFFTKMELSKEGKEFLEYCKKKKIKTALVTDMTTQVQLNKVDELRIGKYFDHIITSEQVGAEKPDPRIFRHALSLLGEKPEDALMIGDDHNKDILGAKAIGMKTVHITGPDDWKKAADYLADHLDFGGFE